MNAQHTAIQEEIPNNQKGARNNVTMLKKYIEEERKKGTVIGPFIRNPFGKDARISPLDTRPKRDSDQLRVILNLSHPFKGDSMNASVSKEIYCGEEMKLRYPTIDDLVKIVNSKKGEVKIFKWDLKMAYNKCICVQEVYICWDT